MTKFASDFANDAPGLGQRLLAPAGGACAPGDPGIRPLEALQLFASYYDDPDDPDDERKEHE